MARLDAVEGKHGESGKKGKAARGQIMSSHLGHDQESGFNFTCDEKPLEHVSVRI